MKRLGACAFFIAAIGVSEGRGDGVDYMSANPISWPALQLLDGLDPGVRAEREGAVQAALKDFPGSAETFLLALLGQDYIAKSWGATGRAFAPLDPGRRARSSAPERRLQFRGRAFCGTGDRRRRIPALERVHGEPADPGPRWRRISGRGRHAVGAASGPRHGSGEARRLRHHGDGFEELTEWLASKDGLLCETSKPTSGRDLFGTAGGWRDGFQKLSVRTGTGMVSSPAIELTGLFVWVDSNYDAVPQDGEVSDAWPWDHRSHLPSGTPAGTFVREGRPGPCGTGGPTMPSR